MSRVTLVGERRRVDLVLPSREPVGRLLPEVMRLLDDQVGTRPQTRHLVAGDGSVLEPDATLESAAVADGAVLRLVRVEDAPSAPVIHDVTDEAADDLDVRAWRWNPAARRVLAGAATVVWALAASALARQEFVAQTVGTALVVLAVLGAAGGAVAGRAGARGFAATLVVTGGALGVFGVWSLGDAHAWSGPARLAGVAGVAAGALLLLGWCSSLGRGGLFGAAALVGGGVCWEAALFFQPAARSGALLAVVSVIVLGLLPRFALMASGLAGLDDRRSGGVSVSRYQVSTALAATHRGLALATVVTAASAAVAGALALRTVSLWTVLLAAAVALVLGLRARAYPLVPEVVALLAAAAVVLVRLAWVWQERSDTAAPLVVPVALAVIPLAVLVVQPPEHVGVRLRRLGDVLESIGVISLFPLLMGVFGVYGRLLGTFA
ncbi:type VII secretion integral membrane protein EccD [Streptomyces griseoluteus]|uniref:type VII secretion integral membrane protein EccD n=1 Tax=Streptomyces griseoluteus TaxID=29306 RepID=UPI0036F9BD85